jgi:hypothetical protein
MAKGARSAHDEAYEIIPPACGSRPGFYLPNRENCDFSVGTAFVYCALDPLTEPFFFGASPPSRKTAKYPGTLRPTRQTVNHIEGVFFGNKN